MKWKGSRSENIEPSLCAHKKWSFKPLARVEFREMQGPCGMRMLMACLLQPLNTTIHGLVCETLWIWMVKKMKKCVDLFSLTV